MNSNEDGDLEKRRLTSEQETADLRKALQAKQAAATTEQDRRLKDELVVAGDEEDVKLMQEFSELNQEMVIKLEKVDKIEEADGGGETNGIDLIETPESGEASGRTDPRFRCQHPGCTSSFKHKGSLKQHQNVHTAKFQCRECQKCFQSRTELRRHRAVHSDDRPFACDKDDCGKWFKTKDLLCQHLKLTHSSLRLFQCQVCQKCFNSLQKLKQHQAFHSDDWPFACDLHGCGGTFKWEDQLRQHRKQEHSIELLFKCNETGCDKSFEESVDLQKPIQTVHTLDI